MIETPHNENQFSRRVAEKEKWRMKAQHDKPSVWKGFGLFGMVGWSVAVPTLLGVALGIWGDKKFPQHFSWTLSGLLLGLIVGCVMAWNWVSREDKSIHHNNNTEDNHE